MDTAAPRSLLPPALAPPPQAPEVLQGAKESAASDVYSFGMVMLEVSDRLSAAPGHLQHARLAL